MLRYRLPSLMLLLSVGSLTGLGVVMLYSTTANSSGEGMLKLQFLWIGVGLVLGCCVYAFDYRKLTAVSKWLMLFISLPLLYLALLHLMYVLHVPHAILRQAPFVEGATKGAFRWLSFHNRTIQPSEFAKVCIMLFMAWWYGRNPRYAESFKQGLFKPMLVVGSVVFLILAGGSLSVTVITSTMVMAMLFIAGIRVRWFVILILIGLVGVAGILKMSPERRSRVTSFRNPEVVGAGTGYQLWSSYLAMGSGGWWGVGFNQSRMKESYLPEAHTDFILAIVGEELGFSAILSVMLFYTILVGSAFTIAIYAADREGLLLAFGIGIQLGLQAFVNLGVVSGFLPTTGVTAPLISYGGSSMLVTWVTIGLLANVARIAARAAIQEQNHPAGQKEPLLVQHAAGASVTI